MANAAARRSVTALCSMALAAACGRSSSPTSPTPPISAADIRYGIEAGASFTDADLIRSAIGPEYDGQYAGSGTGTSSMGTPARVDLALDVSEGVISIFKMWFRIDTIPDTRSSYCGGTFIFSSTRIDNDAFSASIDDFFRVALKGAFPSAESAGGSVEIAPGTSAQTMPWCLPATVNWPAVKGAPSPLVSLNGIVTDTNGGRLAGVRVAVLDGPNTDESVITNGNGEYAFPTIIRGDTNFSARKNGYQEDRRSVFVNGTNTLNFSLPAVPWTRIHGGVYWGGVVCCSACT